MHWIAPSEKNADNAALEKRLWDAADQLRANSELKSQEYSAPVLGLIFLRFAEVRFTAQRAALEKASTSSRRGSRLDEPAAYHAEGILYLPAEARFDFLLNRPEAENIGAKVNAAMRDIEKQNPQLAGVLPKTYNIFGSTLLKELLKKISEIPVSSDYDTFGRVYEYFLGEFAMAEGQGGGEFYTPSSIVRLLTEIIEPFHGRILDPACGSGGMFVQSARFVSEHQKSPAKELAIYGQEKERATGDLCRMNLAVHGLEGDIKQAISYYDDPHDATGRFDFVLANPPFNVNAVDKERLKDQVGPGRRFPFGLPRTDNANSLWIQLFYSALNEKGRAGFVMANSASDARGSEQDIRKQFIESRAVDVMVAVGPNFFYTVTLPVRSGFLINPKLVGLRCRAALGRMGRAAARPYRIVRKRSCSLMPATFTGRWIGRTANGRRRRPDLLPTSSASIAAKIWISLLAATMPKRRLKKFSEGRARPVPRRHAPRNRSARLVAQPRPLRGRGRRRSRE